MPETMPAVTLQQMPIDKIQPNPWNRQQFDSDALNELTESIKAGGIRKALIVRSMPDGSYQIASCNRRWLAAQKAGLKEVPCWIQPLTDEQVAEMDVINNVQRADI